MTPKLPKITRRQKALSKQILDPSNKTIAECKVKAGYVKGSSIPYKESTKLAISRYLTAKGYDPASIDDKFQYLLNTSISVVKVSDKDLELKLKAVSTADRILCNVAKLQESGGFGRNNSTSINIFNGISIDNKAKIEDLIRNTTQDVVVEPDNNQE